jgi:hypothetical protein
MKKLWRKILNLQEFFICQNENFKINKLLDRHVSKLMRYYSISISFFFLGVWGFGAEGDMTWWSVFFLFFSWTKRLGSFPQVMGHWHSPVWDPGTTKGPWFKPRGVQATLLPAICQGGANDVSGPVCCCASKGEKRLGKFWFGLFS